MSRLDRFFGMAHQVTLNAMLVIGGLVLYNSLRAFGDRRERLKEWTRNNPHWDSDPFFVYDPNYMRHNKKDEEEILLTRPMWYAAVELRQQHGIPLQPPYLPISNPLQGRDGNKIAEPPADSFDNDFSAAVGGTAGVTKLI